MRLPLISITLCGLKPLLWIIIPIAVRLSRTVAKRSANLALYRRYVGVADRVKMKGANNMNFQEIAEARQSCRSFDESREVEEDKLTRILEAARLSPSACNGQPYFITVCRNESAKEVARATQGMGMNKFSSAAPVQIVISEMPYVATAAFGAKVKDNDYRSIDIGILSAYITAAAEAEGLGSCILGWLDGEKIRKICSLDVKVRLVISIGYPTDSYAKRDKKRKDMTDLLKYIY